MKLNQVLSNKTKSRTSSMVPTIQRDHLSELPHEISDIIVSYLSIRSRIMLARTSKLQHMRVMYDANGNDSFSAPCIEMFNIGLKICSMLDLKCTPIFKEVLGYDILTGAINLGSVDTITHILKSFYLVDPYAAVIRSRDAVLRSVRNVKVLKNNPEHIKKRVEIFSFILSKIAPLDTNFIEELFLEAVKTDNLPITSALLSNYYNKIYDNKYQEAIKIACDNNQIHMFTEIIM